MRALIVLCFLAAIAFASSAPGESTLTRQVRDDGSRCKSGPSEDRPYTNSRCYTLAENQKRPHPRSCNKYLQCSPATCRWTEKQCPNGQAWNYSQNACVRREEADCSGSGR